MKIALKMALALTFIALSQSGTIQACLGGNIDVSVHVTPIACCGSKGSLSITATGGFEPYLYSIDNGLTWHDNSVFDIPAGRYEVKVIDLYNCQSQTKVVRLCNKPCSECIKPETLLLSKKYSHGAPIQSVAFMCDERCSCILAAIGGYLAYPDSLYQASIRAYQLDPSRDLLEEISINIPVPTNFVYGVDWCCIDGIPYLAVGGCPDEFGVSVWVYKYDDGVLTQVASFVHKGTIFSLAWLCDECTGNLDVRFLAVGGEPAHGIDIRLSLQ